MSILVTGGAGFIGSQLLRTLSNLGEKIVCIDNLSYAGVKENIPDTIEHHQIDICDKDAVEYVFDKEKFDTVFHLAAESHVDNSINNCGPF